MKCEKKYIWRVLGFLSFFFYLSHKNNYGVLLTNFLFITLFYDGKEILFTQASIDKDFCFIYIYTHLGNGAYGNQFMGKKKMK